MIEEIQGDVFKSKEKVLIHGCNCFCNWGAGVAKRMRELYPQAYEMDLISQRGDKNKLGHFTWWTGVHHYYDQQIVVVNLYSQYMYGRDKVHADYKAIQEGLEEIEFVWRGSTFAMPKIGAGLAGGDWNKIKDIITDVFIGYKKNEIVKVYYL